MEEGNKLGVKKIMKQEQLVGTEREHTLRRKTGRRFYGTAILVVVAL